MNNYFNVAFAYAYAFLQATRDGLFENAFEVPFRQADGGGSQHCLGRS